MSNAKIRAHLETCSAPVIAYMVEQGWVHDDCGILNAPYNIREHLLVASRAVQNMTPVTVPERTYADYTPENIKRVRERL